MIYVISCNELHELMSIKGYRKRKYIGNKNKRKYTINMKLNS